MVDLKINLLPAASPRAFFCSPHTAETCGTWGGGRDKMSGDLSNQTSTRAVWVCLGGKVERFFCLRLGRDFCQWQSFFFADFCLVLFNASSPQNGD